MTLPEILHKNENKHLNQSILINKEVRCTELVINKLVSNKREWNLFFYQTLQFLGNIAERALSICFANKILKWFIE